MAAPPPGHYPPHFASAVIARAWLHCKLKKQRRNVMILTVRAFAFVPYLAIEQCARGVVSHTWCAT